ncbi:hypothetical protein [Vibrio diazotrophicus]|uniref:hypothetical protein n=1 Tax=Vibrio diazotrophicus TaxID=685 RepID=UPI00142E6115|nr:hypothetical protein [Vibrio diazotrophicus]NIY94491.1 hypothetical protein [Vibrio diazotrophicus]
MSSAKKLTILLLLMTLLLVAILSLRPERTQTELQVHLIDNTLTQSLDGQRRYFLIESKDIGKQLINVPPTTDCQIGEVITVQKVLTEQQDVYYRFISCP